ncbi:MAG: DUF559 domain-containing protein [Pseudomonadota bacterium]
MRRPFKPRNTERAQELRRQATPAERKLWQYLSKRQLHGYKLSRQIPIDPYVCDFVCRSEKLIIELDGYSHETAQKANANRTRYLQQQGYRIIRFTNDNVFQNVEGVLVEIQKYLQSLDRPTPSPSRLREGRIKERPSRLREGRK